MNITKIRELALELTDEEIKLLVEEKRKQKAANPEIIISETRLHMDSVEDLISNINPKLKRAIDIAKQQPPTNAPRR